MASNFYPRREAEILSFTSNFRKHLVESGESFGVPTEMIDAYVLTQADFAEKFRAAADPAMRTRSAISAKDESKASLESATRAIARIVRAHPSVTRARLIEMGLVVARAEEARDEVVNSPPVVHAEMVIGRRVKLRLTGAWSSSGRSIRSRTCAGAALFYFVGDEPPSDRAKWAFFGNMTRPRTEVSIGPAVPAGSRVWFTASFFTTRGTCGALATPVDAHIGGGVARAA